MLNDACEVRDFANPCNAMDESVQSKADDRGSDSEREPSADETLRTLLSATIDTLVGPTRPGVDPNTGLRRFPLRRRASSVSSWGDGDFDAIRDRRLQNIAKAEKDLRQREEQVQRAAKAIERLQKGNSKGNASKLIAARRKFDTSRSKAQEARGTLRSEQSALARYTRGRQGSPDPSKDVVAQQTVSKSRTSTIDSSVTARGREPDSIVIEDTDSETAVPKSKTIIVEAEGRSEDDSEDDEL